MNSQPIYAVMNAPTGQFVELDIAQQVHYVAMPSASAIVFSPAVAYHLKRTLMSHFDKSIRRVDERVRELTDVDHLREGWGIDKATLREAHKEELTRLALRKELIQKQKAEARFVVVEVLYKVIEEEEEEIDGKWDDDMLCPFPKDGYGLKVCPSGKPQVPNKSGVRRPD